MPYVYSTATCSTDFVIYVKPDPSAPAAHNEVKHRITIKGGANVADKNIVTKLGVATKVSDDDYEYLKTCPHFQKAVKAGFYVVEDIKANAEKVAKNSLNAKDKSAPKVPGDPDLQGKFKK